MIDYKNLRHHPLSEKVVDAVCEKVGTTEKSFFRTHVAYYFSVVASMMRTDVAIPGSNNEPVSVFAVNLAPSGFGKGHSTSIIEDEVIDEFRSDFIEETLPLMAETNLPKIANRRASRNGGDPDQELERVQREFNQLGTLLFSFDSATPPAVKQLRSMLLMANGASMNLQTDEIGANLMANKDVMMLFLELFNGRVKNKLVKNTTESIRNEEIKGVTPTNMMLFGVPSGLLDGGRVEEEFTSMLSHGYARRCFFGFVPEDHQEELKLLSPEEQLNIARNGTADAALEQVTDIIGPLADMSNAHRVLEVPDDTAKLYFLYKNDCALRAHNLKDHEDLRRSELKQRFFKTMKLAGAYAFVDSSTEVKVEHLEAAIALAEESGEAFRRILSRDRSYVKLAKYMAKIDQEVTQTDLIEDLPFYRGTKSQKDELVMQAIAWGYKNNIIIKRKFSDNIEMFSGETLKATDTDKIIVSYSNDIADGYENQVAPFDKLHKLTNKQGLHWINHHLLDGHRHDTSCVPGFNMIVLDIDHGVPLSLAKSLLSDYKALYYTTKRHTDDDPRFRILLPTNYQLSLDKDDYKAFMQNVFEWLPFDSDTQTGQRSRKWLSHDGDYEYVEGELFDVLPFIPKTSKNEERATKYKDLQSLDNLERWVIQNSGDGNRNNQLFRYACILMDAGYDYNNIQQKLLGLNSKMSDALEEHELLGTVMVTVGKELAKRNSN